MKRYGWMLSKQKKLSIGNVMSSQKLTMRLLMIYTVCRSFPLFFIVCVCVWYISLVFLRVVFLIYFFLQISFSHTSVLFPSHHSFSSFLRRHRLFYVHFIRVYHILLLASSVADADVKLLLGQNARVALISTSAARLYSFQVLQVLQLRGWRYMWRWWRTASWLSLRRRGRPVLVRRQWLTPVLLARLFGRQLIR